MARYEVKFYISTAEPLTTGQEAEIAHAVYGQVGKPVPKPEDRKVYLKREYDPLEKIAIVMAHSQARPACRCDMCQEHRAAKRL